MRIEGGLDRTAEVDDLRRELGVEAGDLQDRSESLECRVGQPPGFEQGIGLLLVGRASRPRAQASMVRSLSGFEQQMRTLF